MKALLFCAVLLCADLACAGELRDPMRPPQPRAHHGSVARKAPIPVLSAVFIRNDANGKRGGVRKAIVDGRWVRAGDEIGGGRVQAIAGDGVRWVRRGKVHELRLSQATTNFKKLSADPPRAGNGVPEHAR